MVTIDELRQKEQAATPGPWKPSYGDVASFTPHYHRVAIIGGVGADAEFIATARNTYTALLDVADAAERIVIDDTNDPEDVEALEVAQARLREVTP